MASVTLHKAKRILTTAGPLALARRGLKQAVGVGRAYCALSFGSSSLHTNGSVESLLDYGSQLGGGVIAPFQVRSEIVGLLSRVRDLKPKVVVEIGTANGGTLFLFTRVADPAARLVSVDLPAGEFGEGYPAWKIPLYRSFALPGQRIDLIRGDSHSEQTLTRLRETLSGNGADVTTATDRPVDFLFIDGDHTYEGVKKDFDMYSTLVRPGGIIAFHDVAHHESDNCQVDRLWAELRTRPGAEDLIENPAQGWAGIGVLRV